MPSPRKREENETNAAKNLDRREYLQAVGATATATGLLGGASVSAAAAEDYETITVDPNTDRFVTVGSGNDSPSVLENKIYDVTADGAAVTIYAEGTDWVIRDIGVRGVGNGDGYTVGGLVSSPDGTGLIENVYLGDGSATNSGRVGIFVFRDHEGTVTIRDCNVQSFSDNGIYASTPGHDEGGNGVVQIENCYSHNNNISQYRLGTDGSYVRGSVAHVDADVPDAGGKENARGVWVRRGGNVDVEDNDILLEHEDATWCVIESAGDGQANVIDSHVEAGSGAAGKYSGNVTTTNVGSNPDVTMPSCVPQSVEDAADGSDCGGSDPATDRFKIVAGSDTSNVSYEFTVDGSVWKVTDNGDDAADSNDTIIDNGDGTYTVEGLTGNGYGDTYDYDGTLDDWWSDHPESDYALYVNGSEIQPEDIGGGSSGTVVDDFEDGDIAEYSFDRGSSGASVVSAPTHGGSYALEYADASVEAISTSGLNAYPSAGDTFSFRVRASGGADMTNLSYGVQDHQNRYFVRVNVADDNLALYRYENGSGTQLAADWSVPALSQDAWYEAEVEWGSSGDHTVTLLDAGGSQVAQISGSDATWTSGGVGYDAYLESGESAYFDDVIIR